MQILGVTPLSTISGASALVTVMNFNLRIPDTLRIWGRGKTRHFDPP